MLNKVANRLRQIEDEYGDFQRKLVEKIEEGRVSEIWREEPNCARFQKLIHYLDLCRIHLENCDRPGRYGEVLAEFNSQAGFSKEIADEFRKLGG